MVKVTAAKLVGGNGQVGTSTATSGLINNGLSHDEQIKLVNDLTYAINNDSKAGIITAMLKWTGVDNCNYLREEDGWGESADDKAQTIDFMNAAAQKLGTSFSYNPNDSLHNNINAFWGSVVESASSVDSSTLIATGAIGTAVFVAGATLYNYNGNWVKAATGAGSASIIQYGPMNPGPLPAAIANTFRSGTYNQVVTEGETVLYRVYGGNAGELGSYWTKTPPTGPVQSIIDSALNPLWGNTATNVVKAKIPSGTTIYEGYAAAQEGLVGGGSQIWIQEVNPSWIIK